MSTSGSMPLGRRLVLSLLVFATLLCATLLAFAAFAPGVLHALGERAGFRPSTRWSNTVTPPVLEDPLEVVLGDDLEPGEIDDFDRVGCAGLIYRVAVPADRDARISMARDAEPLRYPLWVTGGRNVHLVGLELRPVVQPGCEVGEAHQVRDPRPNIHPRLVGGKALRLQQSGTTFIEGLDVDLAGMEADCVVARNPDGMDVREALATRAVYIVNSRCTGIEGLDDSPVGDGIHGDFFQNQGKDDVGRLVIENVTVLTSSNGITLHNWSGSENRTRLFRVRNMDYGWDPRYAADDDHEISGLAFTAGAVKTEFESVWLDDPRGLNYGIVNGQRIGSISQKGYIERHPGLFSGRPESGSHAPAERTGLEYASPLTPGR